MQKNIQIFEDFSDYHYQSDPLILGNVWDVPSALELQRLGFKALGTSSAAIASMLGYEDGENMPFSEYLLIIKRITEKTELPISVDLEAGYGNDPEIVYSNIRELSQIGVVGINLEDSVVENGSRTLANVNEFACKLVSIHKKIKDDNMDMFINLRIDTFLLQSPNAIEESIERIDHYSNFIDGIFLPCISASEDIEQIVHHTNLPLNVMSVPSLPDFGELRNLGVKRISTGNFLYDFMYNQLTQKTRSIIENSNFEPLFNENDR